MDKVETQALQVTKEIVVKFVETGRISPTNFSQYFGEIYETVLQVIRQGGHGAASPGDDTTRD